MSVDEEGARLALEAENIFEDLEAVGDDGKPGLRRLDRREAEGFGAARKDEAIERGEELADVARGEFAEKMHARFDAVFARQRLEPQPVLPLARERQMRVGNQRQDSNRRIELFEGMQAGGAAEQRRAVGQAEVGARLGLADPRRPCPSKP